MMPRAPTDWTGDCNQAEWRDSLGAGPFANAPVWRYSRKPSNKVQEYLGKEFKYSSSAELATTLVLL